MNRTLATKALRELLDFYELDEWKVRLNTDINFKFYGLCSYRDKAIILNAHHIDTHPDQEVFNTIRHEVAHALCPGDSHGDIWAAKAKELGCTSVSPCASYSLSMDIIDAFRSGADVQVDFDIETTYKPKYTVSRLQDICTVCGKVAKEVSRTSIKAIKGYSAGTAIKLECGHISFKKGERRSPFEDIVFDGSSDCKHEWNSPSGKTVCSLCNAKRLYPYQVEGALAIEKANGRLGVFDEMGLGKTIEALAYLKYHKEAFPYAWVTKSGIKFQHAAEIVRLLGRENFPQVIMTGKDKFIPGMAGYLFSYDIFRKLDLEEIHALGIQCIVLDECQAIKNPDSSRTVALRAIIKKIPKVIPLSGTPWKNRGSEFFVALNLLDPKRFHSFKSFKDEWVDTYWEGNKLKEGGIANIPKFKEFTKDIIIRRERKDVMPELPLINRMKLVVPLPEYARKTIQVEEDKLMDLYNDAVIGGEEDSFTVKAAINQSIMVMRQIIGIAKVPETVDFVKEFLDSTSRKTVVFVHHKECARLILLQMEEFCKENSLPAPLSMNAGLDAYQRNELQVTFNAMERAVMVASTLASGEGLNLQTCSDCVMHERQWNPQNEEQAEGRFIRIGQKASQVNATYVHGDDSVDTILDALVERKRMQFQQAMNSGVTPSWNEDSLTKDVIEALILKRKNRSLQK